MNKELISAMRERGADLVRFVDISELPAKQTQGFTKAVLFCLVLSKKYIIDIYNNIPIDGAEFLEKEQKADELGEWLASYLQQKGYRALPDEPARIKS